MKNRPYKYKIGQVIYPFGTRASGAAGHEVIDRRRGRDGGNEYVLDHKHCTDNMDCLGRYRPYWWKEADIPETKEGL